MTITLEAIRAAGGIVHSDGNIFFRDISMLQGLAGAAPAAVAGPAMDVTLDEDQDEVAVLLASLPAPAAPAPAVPDGWRLVPANPTDAMLGAAQKAWLADPLRRSSTLYVAALAAAPQAPAAPSEAQRLAQFLQDRQTCLGSSRASAGKYNQESWDDYERAWTMLLGMAAPAAPSAIATQVIENLLQLARIVNTAVEDWGETKEDDSMEVIFHKEEADKMESILEFFDSLPDAPAEEGVIESGPLRAARVLRAQAAPAAPWKDHLTARLVNDLRDCAIKFHGAGQLRERIAYIVAPLCNQLKAAQAAPAAPSYPPAFGPNDWVMSVAGTVVKLSEWEPGAVKARTIYGEAAPAAPVVGASEPVLGEWPRVSGVGRDAESPRTLVLHLQTEASDDELRAIHDALLDGGALATHALSELMHIGYRVEGGKLVPPEKLSDRASEFFGVSAVAAKVAAVHSDDAAVDRFAAEMKAKLAAARVKGRGGWETCPPEVLSRMLREHTEKGDPRDVANFCMFLWCLGHPIGAAPAAPAVDAQAHAETLKKAARYDFLRGSNVANGTVLAEHFGGSRMQDFDAVIDAKIAARAAQAKEGGAPVADAAPLDVCTDPYNCARCKTHPAHRGDMHHAGISRIGGSA